MKKKIELNENFVVNSSLSLDDYKTIFKIIPNFYWLNVKKTSFLVVPFMLLFSILYKYNVLETLVLLMISIFIVIIVYRTKIDWLAEKSYKACLRKKTIEDKAIVEFENKYLLKKTDNCELKINYNEITKIFENSTNYYIFSNNSLINLKKSDCKDSVIKIIEKISVYKKNNNSIKEQCIKNNNKNSEKIIKEIHNRIEKILLVLFVLSILCCYCAVVSVNIVSKKEVAILVITKMWIFWLWLPIPIASIVLGIKYKNRGIKCKKNIIAGCISSAFLVFFGAIFIISPTVTKKYQLINNYADIINVSLPKKGTLSQEHYDKLMDDDKKNITNTLVFYDGASNQIKSFEEEIKKSEFWNKKANIASMLKAMIPLQIKNVNKNYYCLIYNDKTQEYNTLPHYSGTYHIYVIAYYPNSYTLEINDFDYEFKN